jgi:hypothetical protein
VDRVRKARVSSLRREFDALKFHDGETVEEFGVRIEKLMAQIAALGHTYTHEEIVRKFMQVVPPKLEQIATSIETLLDLSEISVDALIGWLKATEERQGGSSAGGDTVAKHEDELLARLSWRLKLTRNGVPECHKESTSGSKCGRGHGRCGGRDDRRGGRDSHSHDGHDTGRDGGRIVAGHECRYCGKKGHWARVSKEEER